LIPCALVFLAKIITVKTEQRNLSLYYELELNH
jgi:hypothetical protein